jgi:hypothetical protein
MLQHGLQGVTDLNVRIQFNRFRDVAIGPQPSSFTFILVGCGGAQHHNCNVLTRGALPDAREHVPAGTLGQVQVEHEQHGTLGRASLDFIQESKRLIAVREHSKMRIHTGLAERIPDELDIRKVVFNDRNPVPTRAG